MRSMLAKPIRIGVFVIGTSTACPADEIPPCPGQCFDFTIERTEPIRCSNEQLVTYPIAFTGTNGYRGRTCFNSTTVPLVVEAIEHLRAGGELSGLAEDVISAYITTVNTVRADLEAECMLAAPGQCTNAAAVCSVVGANAYEQLVIEQICVLGLDGTEPVALADGNACEANLPDQATSSADAGDHCPDASTTTASLDDTAASDGTDDSSSGTA